MLFLTHKSLRLSNKFLPTQANTPLLQYRHISPAREFKGQLLSLTQPFLLIIASIFVDQRVYVGYKIMANM